MLLGDNIICSIIQHLISNNEQHVSLTNYVGCMYLPNPYAMS